MKTSKKESKDLIIRAIRSAKIPKLERDQAEKLFKYIVETRDKNEDKLKRISEDLLE